ncbi:MAG: PorT family protein [Bacteroidetes bacterium]|nr:PorT family protein [Bacteroidota bacterium]
MKYILCLLISAFSLYETFAQKYFDVGLTGGVSYYLGDINPSRQFYRPSPAIGGFVRFNLNKREALRVSLIYMGLKGDGKDFPNNYSQTYYGNFRTSFTEISAVYEFHFLPYVTNKRKNGFSPYLSGGLGYMTFVSAPSNKGNYFSVPFGAGVKYTLSKKLD